jgi:hypothetical protein
MAATGHATTARVGMVPECQSRRIKGVVAQRDRARSSNYKIELLAGLVRGGLANVVPEAMYAGRQPMKVARLRITEAGRRAIRPAT